MKPRREDSWNVVDLAFPFIIANGRNYSATLKPFILLEIDLFDP